MAVGEWDQRQLCPDGACVGVIGSDGTCKVCGHVAPNWGDERRRGLTPPPPDSPIETLKDSEGDDEDDDEYEDDDDEEDDDEVDEAGLAVPDPDWQERKLCTDGACIGVVGIDGICGTCGKRAAG